MSQPSEVLVRRTASGYLVRLCGKGTMLQSPAVRDFICGAMEDGAEVVLDLSQCEYLDSTFLGCLVMLTRRSQQRDGSFALCCDDTTCSKLFGSSKLEKVVARIEQLPETTGDPVKLEPIQLERKEFGQHLLEAHAELAELGGPEGAAYKAIADKLAHDLSE